MPVHDEAREEAVLRELLPDHVGVARDQGGAPVAEVRRQRRPRPHGVGDLRPARPRVPDRDPNAAPDRVLDHRQDARALRGHRQQADPPRGRVLPPPEVVDVGAAHEGARVRPAVAILRRDVRALHVNPRDRRRVRPYDHPGAGREGLEGRRDQRRQEAGHARLPDRLDRAEKRVRRERGVAEVDPREPVHLQVEEARQLDRPRRRPRSERHGRPRDARRQHAPPSPVDHPRPPARRYRSLTRRGTEAPAESIRLTPSSTDRSVSITSDAGSTTTSPT